MQALLTWHIADNPDHASLASYIKEILGDMKGWNVISNYPLLERTVESLISAGATTGSATADKNLYVVTPAQFTESIAGHPNASDCFFFLWSSERAAQGHSVQDFITWQNRAGRLRSIEDDLGSELERCWVQLEAVAEASIGQANVEIAEKQAKALGLNLGKHLGEYVDRTVQEGLERLGLDRVQELARKSEEMAASVTQLVHEVQGALAQEAELLQLERTLGELEQQLARNTPLQAALGFTAPTYFLILRNPAFFQPVEISISVQPEIKGVPKRVVMTEELIYIPTGLTSDSVSEEGANLLFQQVLPQSPFTTATLPLSKAYLSCLANIDLQKDFEQLAQQQDFLLGFADAYRARKGKETTPPLKEAAKLYLRQPTIHVEEALHRLSNS